MYFPHSEKREFINRMPNFSNPMVKMLGLNYKVNYKTILQNINIEIGKGEAVTITGPSGCGKTTLLNIIGRKLNPTSGQISFAEGITSKMVPQQDDFMSASGLRVSYYSQRYENQNQDIIPTVQEYLLRKVSKIEQVDLHFTLNELEIEHLHNRKILSLSNGERKRVQLAEALLQKPDLLLFDQPFVGLDVHARETLFRILEKQKQAGITLVLVSESSLIQPFSDQRIKLRNDKQHCFHNKFDAFKNDESNPYPDIKIKEKQAYQFIVKMRNVKVSYCGEGVLLDINWEIKPGERWLLQGPNGAGKTTLLSLISADNPQGYSNDLVLFDRKRGSGESIWDIKAKIGFVSPELHLYFIRRRGLYNAAASTQVSSSSMKCLDVVLSGFKDEVGFSTTDSHMEVETAQKWLHLLDMEHLSASPFLHVSLGEQRIILLARALIKSPDLLILDEPCQGMDSSQIERFTSILNDICFKNHTTLIYVTHRKEEVPSCITHFMKLEKGHIIESGIFKIFS